MNITPVLRALLCGLLLCAAAAAFAQDKGELTPELKELKAALEIKEAPQQLDALAKYLTKYQTSEFADRIRSLYIDVLFEKLAKQKEQVLLYADKLIAVTPADSQSEVYNDIADGLIKANIAPEKAEEFATKSLSLIDEKLERERKLTRAVNLATLGEAYLKLGKKAEARKALMEAYAARPSLRDAPVALAQLESEEGNYQAALNYLIPAALTGRMPEEGQRLLSAIYQKLHNNSLAGFEEMLDAEYEKRYPSPIKVEHYKPTPERSNRLVLAEIFSSASCPPCQAADLAFEAAMQRYSRKELLVLMYHLHIPRPDPMTNPAAEARGEFYGVESTPTSFVDGRTAVKGGGLRDEAVEYYNELFPKLEKQLESRAQAEIQLDAAQQGQLIKVKAAVSQIKSAATSLKLRLVLVENQLRYSGESGIRYHPMVVRSMANAEADGFDMDASAPAPVEYTFDLNKINADLQSYLSGYEKENEITFQEKKLPLEPNNLLVVAFVQDTKTKQILQAAFVKPKAGGAVAVNQ